MSHQLRSRDGSEYLIQHDSEAIISTWHKAIAQGIQELVSRLRGGVLPGLVERGWPAIMQGISAHCEWGPPLWH